MNANHICEGSGRDMIKNMETWNKTLQLIVQI